MKRIKIMTKKEKIKKAVNIIKDIMEDFDLGGYEDGNDLFEYFDVLFEAALTQKEEKHDE